MEKNKIILGKRYNRLIPIEKINKKDKRGWNEIWYRCKCDCGNEKIIRGNKIASGHTRSCGCYKKEQTSKSTKKINGLSTSRIYRIYKTMISRCYNKNSTKYYAYGARGINVCEEWKNDFLKFYDWAMKNGYKESLTIDRIDVNGDYCIENCRWIKMEEQASNKRNTIKIKYKNYDKTIKEWSNLVHIKPNTIKFRFKKGWDIEDVLFKPLPHSPWRRYLNGNCITSINIENGTKIHETINEDDINFEFEFSESCDVNITDKCDGGCPWCYQGCTPKSNHADILSLDFLDTIHPYTELAINGNDLSHPDLIPFLKRMKKKEVIVSMTVNQKHFMKNIDFIKYLLDNKLIKGLGVSLVCPNKEFINEVKNFPTAVIHTIAGIITKDELDKLANNDLKILILGYKTMKNRGKDYYENGHKEEIDEKIEWLSNNLGSYLNKFKVVSFDNLCTKQLNVKNIIGEERWKECYMGDDGTHTFYIDLVKKKFARTSISEKQYDLLDNIDDMFKIIKGSENK